MTRSRADAADDIDLATLGGALWRAKGLILALVLLAGAVTFIGLSMMRPLYTSEARILIQNEESAFTRPTTEQGRAEIVTALDEQAVQSQVQVLTSRDLILQVVKDLDLTTNAAFAKDAGVPLFRRFLIGFGLWRGNPESEEERAANALADHLDVFQLNKSSVIAVEYTSGDPDLAAHALSVDDRLGDHRNRTRPGRGVRLGGEHEGRLPGVRRHPLRRAGDAGRQSLGRQGDRGVEAVAAQDEHVEILMPAARHGQGVGLRVAGALRGVVEGGHDDDAEVGPLRAEAQVGLKMNVAKDKLQEVIALVPAITAPTVSPLYGTEWFAVESVIAEATVRDLIPKLLKAGAVGIIEYPLNKIVG